MIPIPFDYETLRVIWWLLLGILLVGFAVMDGFDLGTAMLLPWVGRSDIERRVVVNTIGPVWEGNQVWIILGAGAIFAAWPFIYALSFSGFYIAMLFVLFALILRPVAFKYRSKLQHHKWRNTWDWILCLSGVVAALIFGVAVGNVIQGVPFHYDSDLRVFYTGSFWGLLNPFALFCGLLSVVMLIMHGGVYLANKTELVLQNRATKMAKKATLLTMVLFAIGGVWITFGLVGYEVTSPILHDAPSNPLHKQVATKLGGWLDNYQANFWMLLAPLMGFVGTGLTWQLLRKQGYKLAMVTSSLAIAGIITSVGLSMFPFILPSCSNPSMSLLVWDASSSQTTLFIMLVATALFMPIILVYTAWVYRVLRGRVTLEAIKLAEKDMY